MFKHVQHSNVECVPQSIKVKLINSSMSVKFSVEFDAESFDLYALGLRQLTVGAGQQNLLLTLFLHVYDLKYLLASSE